MPVREGPAQPAPPPAGSKPYSAEEARSGEIILRTRRRRALFIGGLAALILLAIILSLAA